MTTAVVVGSGPNGLAAAATLAVAGVEVTVLEQADAVGGGTRSSELTVPGVVHDECSGFHPLSLDSAFARHIDLAAEGLEWAWPDVQFSSPLDEQGRGAATFRSVEETVQGLGPDGRAWQRVIGSLAPRFADISKDFLQPLVHVPHHPLKLARFGIVAALPVAALTRQFATAEGANLWAGVAAHAFRPFSSPFSAAIGVALGAATHAYGWPVAVGGSQAIADAMVAVIEQHGGKIETGVTVQSLAELSEPDIVMLDTSPLAAANIASGRMPSRVAAAYRNFRHGPGAFKVDYAVEEGVPWLHEPSRRAGTVHVCGTADEVATVELEVSKGRMPERPFVLVGQQYLADPSRSAGNIHPLYAYAHVPAGYTGDATELITAQIERFAPGFRDQIVATHIRTTTELSQHNPNFIGGDIVTGANTARQLLFRPRITMNPYETGIPGVYLCSAATPPGAGAHGMCGFNAAVLACDQLKLIRLRRDR